MSRLSATLTNPVFVYLCICICVFASQTPRNIVFEILLPLPFQKYSTCHVCLQLWPMLYLRICVCVYLYLCICKSDTQEHCFWGPLTITFFSRNIAHVMSICNFDQCCICVFVYLCIYICVFASQTPRNIVFEVLLSCHMYHATCIFFSTLCLCLCLCPCHRLCIWLCVTLWWCTENIIFDTLAPPHFRKYAHV